MNSSEKNTINFFVLSNDKSFERLFYEVFLGNLVYLYLLIMILKRYFKNREIADLRKKRLSQSLKNKMILIAFLLIIDVLMIISAFNFKFYWLYGMEYYSLCYIFQIMVLIIQISMMKFEFSKTIPYTWYLHHLFWILLTILHLLYLLNTFLIQCEQLDFECLMPNVIFDGIRLLISGVLMLYQLIFKFQDLPDFEMIWNCNTRPLMTINSENINRNSLLNEKPEEKIEDSPKRLRLKANIKNKLINNNNRVFFQVNLELNPQKSVKLFKTIEDFIKLDEIIQENKSSFLYSKNCPPLPKLNFQTPVQSNLFSSEFFLLQRGLFENYLRVFLENELFPLALLDFLEIKEPFKTRCIQIFHKKFILKEENPEEMILEEEKIERNISVSSVVFTEKNREIENKAEFLMRNDAKEENSFMKKRFCVFFNVQMKEWVKENQNDYYSFIFELSLVEKPEEFWKINKRYSDFIRLDQELKKVFHRNMPALPEKKLLLDTNILNIRGKKLAKYLRTLLNEKVYFHNILFDFIKLSNENYDILKNTEFQLEPELYLAEILEHTVIIDNEDKQPYIAYILRIVKFNDLEEKNILKEHKIIKRFSDFERLHKILLIRFGNLKNFPSFPSKIPSFLASETINLRKKALEKYLNDLFNVENIGDSVAFRKFLNVDAKERGNFIMNVSNVERENEEFLGNSENLQDIP